VCTRITIHHPASLWCSRQGAAPPRLYKSPIRIPPHHSPFAIRYSPFFPFTIRKSLVAHHRGRLAAGKIPATQQGRVWDPPLPGPGPFSIRRRCSLFSSIRESPFPGAEAEPARAQRRGAPTDSSCCDRAGLGPAPTWTSTIRHSQFAVFPHSPFAIRKSLFAHRRARLAAGKMPVPQHNQGRSGTRPYLDQHLAAFAIAVVQPAGRSGAEPLGLRRLETADGFSAAPQSPQP
jgi:hypothetical protein